MANALTAIQIIMQRITEGSNQEVVRYLNLLQINKLDSNHSNSLLSRFLTTAAEYNNTNVVSYIINAFEPNFTDRYQLPLLNVILMENSFEDEVVSFVLRQYQQFVYKDLAFNYIDWDADENIITGLVRLESNRGPLNVDDYQELYDRSFAKSNNVTQSFFAYHLNLHSGYAEIPAWVRNFTESEDLPYDDEIILPETGPFIFEVPESTEEIVTLLSGGLRANGRSQEEIEAAQAELRKRLVAATPEDKMSMIKEGLENKSKLSLAEDEDLFVILGPANSIVDADLVSDNGLCYKYGGCRMLSCLEFEDFMDPSDNIIYPLDEYKPTDWFTGSCGVCHLKIRRPAHAIRLPLEHGGWIGCYCSEKCLRQRLPKDNLLIAAMIDHVIADLNRIGLQDRLVRNKEDGEGIELELGLDNFNLDDPYD